MMRIHRSNLTTTRRSPGKAADDYCNCETRWRPSLGLGAARSHASRRRRGVAIVLVLGLVSIALAMAYALLRSQSLNVLMQGNGNLRNEAREAALSGLAAGLQQMSNRAGAASTAPSPAR